MKIIVNIVIFVTISVATVLGQEIKTKEFLLTNYNKIEVRNSIDVKLVTREKEGVLVTCDERLLPAILVEQRNETLKIGLDNKQLKKITGRKRNHNIYISKKHMKINGLKFKGGLQVTVYVKDIKEITSLSSSDIEWEGNLPSHELYITAGSFGNISWKGTLTIDKLYIISSSSGDIKGDYKGENAFIKLDSFGNYKGNIEAETLDIQLAGSGDFTGGVKADKAVFTLSSFGDAEVQGVIDSLYVTAGSSAEFKGKKIRYKYAEAKTTSFANIYLSKSGEVIDKTPRRTGVFID